MGRRTGRLHVSDFDKVDQGGKRVAPGDKVAYHLEPTKWWKRKSIGTVVRWVSPRVCEVRHRDGSLYDLCSHEILLVLHGRAGKRAERTIHGREFLS